MPYGRDCPTPKPHPRDKEIEEETIPGQGEPTRPPQGARRNGTRRNHPSGIPADAGKPATARTRRKTQRTVTTPLKGRCGEIETPYTARAGGEDGSRPGTNPATTSIHAGRGVCPAVRRDMRRSETTYYRTSPRSWKVHAASIDLLPQARA